MKRIINNKGFSLVELLVVIVILGLLTTGAIVGVSYLIESSKKQTDKELKNTLKNSAESYFQANQDLMPKDIGDVVEIKASDLYSKKYLKNKLYNSKKENCMTDSYVAIHKISKKEYEYTAYIYCGSDAREDKEKGMPTVNIKFTDEAGTINAFQNVSKAKVVIDMTGGTSVETGEELGIEGYSFSIAVKEGAGASNYYEAFNSGTLSGNLEKELTVEKSLKQYINITTANHVKVSVTVINTDGKKITKDKSTEDQTSYDDNTNPFCKDIYYEAKNDWINASEYYNGGEKRTIQATCEDGDGSGCIRSKFTRTWPNKSQPDAEWGYIQVVDDAGNANLATDYVNAKDPCSVAYKVDSCRVSVKVDTTYPQVKIEAYKRSSDGNSTGGSIFASGVTKTLGGNRSGSAPSKRIASDQYSNLVKGWMNKANYPYGVIYKVSISDNIHLDSWEWKTNEPYKTSRPNNEVYGSGSEKASGTIDDLSFTNNSNCGPRSANDFYVSFVDEGLREGKLTVTDKAGNTTTYIIQANIDRTSPPIPSVEFYKYNSSNTSPSTTKYTTGTWSTVYVQSKGIDPNDRKAKDGNKTLSADLSGFEKFKHKGTRPGGSIAEADGNINFASDTYEGKNEIQYCACDKAGNCSSYSQLYKVWVDTKVPTISLKAYSGSTEVYSSSSTSNSNKTLSVDYTAYKNISNSNYWMNNANYPNGVTYKISMADNVELNKYTWTSSDGNSSGDLSGKGTTTTDKTIKKEGKQTGKIEVKDAAGNIAIINVAAWLDRTAPTKPTVENPKNNTWTDQNVTVKLTSSDNTGGSGIEKFQYSSWYDIPSSNKNSVSVTYTDEQETTLTYRACDYAKNCGVASNSTTIKIDKTAPTVTVVAYSGNTKVYDGITANDSNRARAISNDSYRNLYKGWMNMYNYPNGVTYKISMSDTSGLKSYSWTSPDGNESKTISGKSKSLEKTLKPNGKKKGEISVTDVAGKTVKIGVNAWMDVTPPTLKFGNIRSSHSDTRISSGSCSGTTCRIQLISSCYVYYDIDESCSDNSGGSGCDYGSEEVIWDHNGYSNLTCGSYNSRWVKDCEFRVGIGSWFDWTKEWNRIRDNAGNLSREYYIYTTVSYQNVYC